MMRHMFAQTCHVSGGLRLSRPIDKIIDETAADWAFIAKWTGLEVEAVGAVAAK